jgi:hypothetical protein
MDPLDELKSLLNIPEGMTAEEAHAAEKAWWAKCVKAAPHTWESRAAFVTNQAWAVIAGYLELAGTCPTCGRKGGS